MTEFAWGQQRGGLPAPCLRTFKPRVGSIVPCPAMISSFRRSGRSGRGCHVPDSVPCAARAGVGGTHPAAAVVTVTRRGKKKERAGGRRGDRGCQTLAGALLRGDHGSQSTVLLRTPTFHPRKGEECRAGLETPRMGCRLWPAGWSRRALLGTPAPRSPVPGLRPAAQCALPAVWRWLSSPCRSRATRVGYSGGRGAPRSAGHSPPLLPRSEPSAPPPPDPEKCLYLPPPPPPSRRRYPWRLGTLPSSGPRGCLPSLRVLRRLGERWG